MYPTKPENKAFKKNCWNFGKSPRNTVCNKVNISYIRACMIKWKRKWIGSVARMEEKRRIWGVDWIIEGKRQLRRLSVERRIIL
jgi:hypothetical protein